VLEVALREGELRAVAQRVLAKLIELARGLGRGRGLGVAVDGEGCGGGGGQSGFYEDATFHGWLRKMRIQSTPTRPAVVHQ